MVFLRVMSHFLRYTPGPSRYILHVLCQPPRTLDDGDSHSCVWIPIWETVRPSSGRTQVDDTCIWWHMPLIALALVALFLAIQLVAKRVRKRHTVQMKEHLAKRET